MADVFNRPQEVAKIAEDHAGVLLMYSLMQAALGITRPSSGAMYDIAAYMGSLCHHLEPDQWIKVLTSQEAKTEDAQFLRSRLVTLFEDMKGIERICKELMDFGEELAKRKMDNGNGNRD